MEVIGVEDGCWGGFWESPEELDLVPLAAISQPSVSSSMVSMWETDGATLVVLSISKRLAISSRFCREGEAPHFLSALQAGNGGVHHTDEADGDGVVESDL
ncbi:MAG: hypothetical protein M2R45_04214 [Verrucomicrobia subdivision 3 bacterium]|nr:hypothetical protein [Limisphaerales bacterium]MCS1417049.1 hypothetical protein [Limisphaerales bacterium]